MEFEFREEKINSLEVIVLEKSANHMGATSTDKRGLTGTQSQAKFHDNMSGKLSSGNTRPNNYLAGIDV